MRPTRSAVVTAAVLASVVVSACADDAGPTGERPASAVIVTTTAPPTTTASSPTTPPPTPTTSAPPPSTPPPTPTTPTTTAPPPTTPPPTPRVGDPVVAAELVVEVDQPLDLAVRPGDAALYLVGQRGLVTRFDPTSGTADVVLDLTGRVAGGNEQGLLGAVFTPAGDLAYVDFTDPTGTTVIAEYGVGPDGAFDPATERIVLEVAQPFANHNAGDLAFGPDGLLYVTLGDGGSGGDPGRRASDPSVLLGSLLRIDPTPGGDAPYTVPPDNPFADGVGGAPEVWAWGLRNPWKIAFDPITHDLWIADVGQRNVEEIDRVGPDGGHPAGWGVNFGWSAFEGTERFNTDVSGEGATPPVLTYTHADGCAISGGVPYRGRMIPELEPAYVYGDFCNGTIWALDLDGGRVLSLSTGFEQVTAVRAGPDGELYVLERSGGVHRLVPG